MQPKRIADRVESMSNRIDVRVPARHQTSGSARQSICVSVAMVLLAAMPKSTRKHS